MPHTLASSACFAAAAPTAPADAGRGWASLILQELGRTQATGFLSDLIFWTLLGALTGALIAALAGWGFARLGWYEIPWRFGRPVRWSILLLSTLLAAGLLGLAGFWQGALRGSERVLARSQLGTDLFPRLADVLADAIAWVQLHALETEGAGDTNRTATAPTPDDFRAGRWEVHVPRFRAQLADLQESTVTNALDQLERRALERMPALQGGLGERLLHWCLTGLGRSLVEKQVTRELQRWGADRIYRTIREPLELEAARAGPPETISRSELSAFLVREALVPGALQPIRSTARAQQIPLIIVTALILCVPPWCIRTVANRGQRSPAPPQPPALPAR